MVGNKPNYEEEDITRTFLSLNEKPVSRQELSKKLDLGEGTIRTILDILRKKGLVESNNQGNILSGKGKNKKKYEKPKRLSLKTYKDLKSCGLLIRKADNIKIGFELRDEAIRRGTHSALIFRYDKELKLPNSEVNFKEEYRQDYESIIKSFRLEEKCIVIVTFDKNYSVCENAAIAVANKMLKLKAYP